MKSYHIFLTYDRSSSASMAIRAASAHAALVKALHHNPRPIEVFTETVEGTLYLVTNDEALLKERITGE